MLLNYYHANIRYFVHDAATYCVVRGNNTIESFGKRWSIHCSDECLPLDLVCVAVKIASRSQTLLSNEQHQCAMMDQLILRLRGGGSSSTELSQEEVTARSAKAAASMKTCYQVVALSALFDIVAELILEELKSSGWRTTAMNVLATLWKVVFSVGLYRASQLQHKFTVDQAHSKKSDDTQSLLPVLTDICSIMARVWRQSAWTLFLIVALEVTDLVESKTPDWVIWTSSFFLGLFAAGSLLLRESSHREVESLVISDGQSMLSKEIIAARKASFLVSRNMLFCVAASLLNGISLAVMAFQKSQSMFTLVFNLSGVTSHIITARLLWKFQRAFLEVAVHLTSPLSKDQYTFVPLWQTQAAFYSDITSTFRFEILAKAIAFLVHFGHPLLAQSKL